MSKKTTAPAAEPKAEQAAAVPTATPAKAEKLVYVGPTINGVAARNTVYTTVPRTLQEAAETAPFLLQLLIPITDLPEAMRQIQNKEGFIFALYKKALTAEV